MAWGLAARLLIGVLLQGCYWDFRQGPIRVQEFAKGSVGP